MAKQKGNNKLTGKVGDMTYYKTRRYGDVARSIGYVPKEVREQSPSFAPVRKNNTEFGVWLKAWKAASEWCKGLV